MIREFRYLYKCAFIFIPLLIICGAVSLDSLYRFRKPVKWAAFFCSLTSLIAIVYIVYSGRHPYINNSYYDYRDYRRIISEVEYNIDRYDIDRNYRILTVLNPKLPREQRVPIFVDENGSKKNGQKKGVFGCIEVSSKICMYAFTKNIDTYYGLFSIAGYDNYFSEKSFSQSDELMKDMFYEAMMMDSSLQLDSLIQKKNTGELESFEKQMTDNSVKYIIAEERFTNDFCGVINSCEHLSVKRKIPWYSDYNLIEIDGIYPICQDENGKKIPLEASVDSLCFETDYKDPVNIDISMTYDEHYRMELTGEDGVRYVPVCESPGGYVNVTVPSGRYAARLVYVNHQMDAAVIMSVITLLLSVASALALLLPASKFPKRD